MRLVVPIRTSAFGHPISGLSEGDFRVAGSEFLLWPWSDGGFAAAPLRALKRANAQRGWRAALRRGDRVVVRGEDLATPRRRPGFYVAVVMDSSGSLLAVGGVGVSVNLSGQPERISVRDSDVVCKHSLFRALVVRRLHLASPLHLKHLLPTPLASHPSCARSRLLATARHDLLTAISLG